jgi:hypothetical protein
MGYTGAELESLVEKRVTLFSSKAKCSASCENLIRDERYPNYRNRLQQDLQMIIEHLPKLHRVIKQDEIRSLEISGNMTWKEHEKKLVFSTVEGWITRGSAESKEGRAQYGSFSSSPKIFDGDEKYLDQGKNFTEISMSHLADWAEKNKKQVRLPTKSDLELIMGHKGFPTIRIKQDPNAIIIVPISHPEWQDFFMPTLWNYQTLNPKHLPGSKDPATASPFVDWFPGKKGRNYSTRDSEVLIVTDQIPIDLISVSSGLKTRPDPAFVTRFEEAQAKMKEKRDEIVRKFQERKGKQLARQRRNGIDHLPKFKRRTQSNPPLNRATCHGDPNQEELDTEAIIESIDKTCKEMDEIMEKHLRDLAAARAASALRSSTAGMPAKKRSAPKLPVRQPSQF